MTKKELIELISGRTGFSKKQTSETIDATLEIIKEVLAKGNDIAFTGFGTFSVKDRPARSGRNPATGEPMQIAASKAVNFKVGKTLKEAVNQ